MDSKLNKTVNIYRIYHRGAFRLGIYFDYNIKIHSLVKNLGAKWSQSKKCWYLDDDKQTLPKLSEVFKDKIWLNYKDINSKLSLQEKQHYFAINNKPRVEKKAAAIERKDPQDFSKLPDDYINLLERRRYSKNTQRTYISMFSKFVEYFKKFKLDEITDEQIKEYLNYLVTKKKVSSSYQNQMINSIKFYYEHVLGGQRKTYRLDRPRKEFRIPTILSDKEIILLLSKIKNLKHLCIAAMLYSSGLRRGEILNIRKGDVDLDRMEIKIRAGKGNKDRKVTLSENVAVLLVKYVEKYKPSYWLFEGEKKMKYSATSVGQIIKRATKAAGIAKNVTPHVLRHSFATHLVEQGVDIIHVQKLLGHNSVKTTQIYTHVSNKTLKNIKSPLDRIINDRKLDNNNLNKN